MAIQATKSPKVYSLDDGERRGPMTLARVRFHPTARFLFGQCADRRLGVWNLDADTQKGKSGESVVGAFACSHALGWIRGFDINASGTRLVTGGSDRRLKLWKWENGAVPAGPELDVAGHEGWIEAVAFAPDGATLATVGADRLVKLWDATNLRLIKSERAHSHFCRDAAFSPDGRWLVTAGEDGAAIVWDSAKLEIVRRIDTGIVSDQQGQTPALGGVVRLSVSRDSRWLALGSDRQTVIYELTTGHGVGSISQTGADVCFGRALNLLAAGEGSLKVLQYDPARLRPTTVQVRIDPKGNKQPPNLPALGATEIVQIKRDGFSMGVAFSADDKWLAAGRTDGKVELWSLE